MEARYARAQALRRQQSARSAARNRAAVLAACRELLFRDGYHRMTVRSVAEQAGVSPETIYKAFGGKPGLMKALWDVTLAGDDQPVAIADRPQMQEVRSVGSPAEKLRRWAGFVRGANQRLAPLFGLLAQAGPEVTQMLATTAGTADRRPRAGHAPSRLGPARCRA